MQTKPLILVADDDPDLLEQVTFALENNGFRVIGAGSAKEAEEQLLSHRPALAIFDLMMETSDAGFALCHLLRRMYPGTPAMILSAVTSVTGLSFATTNSQAKAWVGAEVFLDKPVSAERLIHEVKRILAARGVAKTDAAVPSVS